MKIVSRDRASAYSEGAKVGAPQARQVADRFHLVKNAGDMLERLLCRRYKQMQEVTRQRAAATTRALLEAQLAPEPEPEA